MHFLPALCRNPQAVVVILHPSRLVSFSNFVTVSGSVPVGLWPPALRCWGHWSFPLRGGVLLTSPCPPQEQCPRGQDWPQQAPVGAEASRALWRRHHHPWQARPPGLSFVWWGRGAEGSPHPEWPTRGAGLAVSSGLRVGVVPARGLQSELP